MNTKNFKSQDLINWLCVKVLYKNQSGGLTKETKLRRVEWIEYVKRELKVEWRIISREVYE